eukprot:2313747-Karenia_brevis.AAC.1
MRQACRTCMRMLSRSSKTFAFQTSDTRPKAEPGATSKHEIMGRTHKIPVSIERKSAWYKREHMHHIRSG